MILRLLVTLALFYLLSSDCHSQPLKNADSLKDAGDYEAAIAGYSAVLYKRIRLSSLDSGNLYLRRGICNYQMNVPTLSLEDYFKALGIFERMDNKERIAAARYNLSIIFLAQKNFKEAENCILISKNLYENLEDSSKLPLIFNDLACIYRETGRYQAAIATHDVAIRKFSSSMDAALLSKHLYNKGNCFEKSNADSSIFYYTKADAIAQATDDSSMMSAVNITLGDVYKGRGQYQKALASFEKALRMDVGYVSTEELNSLYANLADLYDSLRQYEKAYYYSKKERELNEELYNADKSKFAAELSEKYESGKKDEKILSQEIENKLKGRNLLLSLAGLGLAAALAIISFVNFKRKQKANKALQLQNERIEKLNRELDASNQVKSKLFSVISHDIRGPVSSIYAYLQMQQVQNESNAAFSKQTEQLLDTLEDLLVWSKSQLHQFTASAEPVFLHAAINQITALQQTGITEKKLLVKNEVPENFVLQTDANMLTIILRNILANAVKYALPGTAIKVVSFQQGQSNIISIINQTDTSTAAALQNFENPSINSTATGLGLTLIKEFAEKLGGNVAYSNAGNTVAATLSLPSA